MTKLEGTAVVDKQGVLSLELPTNLRPGAHKLTLLVEDELIAVDHNAAQVRQKYNVFLEDWDAPEMSEYDRL